MREGRGRGSEGGWRGECGGRAEGEGLGEGRGEGLGEGKGGGAGEGSGEGRGRGQSHARLQTHPHLKALWSTRLTGGHRQGLALKTAGKRSLPSLHQAEMKPCPESQVAKLIYIQREPCGGHMGT